MTLENFGKQIKTFQKQVIFSHILKEPYAGRLYGCGNVDVCEAQVTVTISIINSTDFVTCAREERK